MEYKSIALPWRHNVFTQNAELGADQRKHQSSALLAFVRGSRRRPVNSPHKEPVTRKMFPFDDIIMACDKPVSYLITITI